MKRRRQRGWRESADFVFLTKLNGSFFVPRTVDLKIAKIGNHYTKENKKKEDSVNDLQKMKTYLICLNSKSLGKISSKFYWTSKKWYTEIGFSLYRDRF